MEMIANRRWLHRYAILVACATFVLIIAGALVTSNDAALSIPSWPLPLHWPSAMGPGGRFELTHRIIAGTVSALTVLLALWLWRTEPRLWVRRLGAVAVLAIVAQAVLGGITVLFELPVAISVSHACLGQAFFCIAVSLAMFTGSEWRWDETSLQDAAAPSLRQLATGTTAVIFLQLMLGAAFRHKGFGIIPHIIGAGLVTIGVLWLLARVLGAYSQEPRLKWPALLLGALLVVQLFLGIASYILRVAAVNAPQPLPPLVDVTTTHVAIGALVLATSLAVTLQTFRLVKPDARASEVRSQESEVRMTAG